MDMKSVDSKLIELEAFIKASVGKKVRYREEGNLSFTNDKIKDGYINNNEVTVVTEEGSIIATTNVYDVSISKYDDREDIFIYGDKCNRFNISY